MRIAEAGVAPIYGINYKDKPSDAAKWLAERGNPYVAIGADERGRITAAWGASGIPETFIIDQAGMIRYRHAGALSRSEERRVGKEGGSTGRIRWQPAH